MIDMTAFLDLIGWSEGTSTSPITQNDGYDIIVTGVDGQHRFDDYSVHPFENGRTAILVRREPPLFSTASGRYQIILPTWRNLKQQLNLLDFSPSSQDRAAAELVNFRAKAEIEADDLEGAITACSKEWASLPGSTAGQGGKSMAELVEKYSEFASA